MRINDIPVCERNYDAGRSANTFQVIDLSYLHLAPFGSVGLVLTARYRHIHQTFGDVYNTWQSLRAKTCGKAFKPFDETTTFAEFLRDINLDSRGLRAYHFLNESLVFQFRKFFETYLQMAQIYKFRETAASGHDIPKKLQIDSLGSLKYTVGKKGLNDLSVLFYGSDGEKSPDYEFLSLINDLGNASRHDAYFDDVYSLIGVDVPTLVGIELRLDGSNSKATYHNHNCFHLMMGFQDVTQRIMERSKAFFT